MSANSEPSRYRVVVRGRMGDNLANPFGELELVDRLRDLGIQFISVNPVD